MSERLQEAEALIAMLANDMEQHDFTRGYLPHWRPRLAAFLEGRPATYDPKDMPPRPAVETSERLVQCPTGWEPCFFCAKPLSAHLSNALGHPWRVGDRVTETDLSLNRSPPGTNGKHAGDCQYRIAVERLVEEVPCNCDALCPHGWPLAENTCGPCSRGRPNIRPVKTSAPPDDPHSDLPVELNP